MIAAALAAAAVLLDGAVRELGSEARQDRRRRASRSTCPRTSYPLGTAGSKIAGNLRAEKVPRTTMTPEAVTSPDQIRSLYTTEPVYAGEQLTLKRFAPPAEQGVRSKLTGNQRAVQLSGDTNQLLAGTLVPGDRVDVVVNLKNPKDQNDVRSFVALRNLLVLQTDKGQGGAKIDRGTTDDHAVILAVTDEQGQRLQYATQNSNGTDSWRSSCGRSRSRRTAHRRSATFATVVNGGAK